MYALYKIESIDSHNRKHVDYEYGEDSPDALAAYLFKHKGLEIIIDKVKVTDMLDRLDAARGLEDGN